MTAAADVPLYRRILGEIEQRIVSGAWPPGHRLPFELELARQYGCSRMTVNKVMTRLVQAGLIERHKKRGSFVLRPQAESAILRICAVREEVETLGLAYAYALVSRARRSARAEDADRLRVAGLVPVLDLTCLHSAGGQPFCLEQRLINLASVPEADEAPFDAVAPGPWLLAQVPWTAAEHRIQAKPADGREAELLQLPAGYTCLVIERQTWGERGPVTNVRLTYPGSRHVVTASFAPGSGGGRLT